MNAIKENTVVFPKMKADQSGVLKVRYSNLDPDGLGDMFTPSHPYEGPDGPTSSFADKPESNEKLKLAGGIINSFLDFGSQLGNWIMGGKYGTDAYNNRLAAEANAAANANAKQKNTGLWIAIVVVALLMVVGFALVITKKRK